MNDRIRPILATWDGDVFIPVHRFKALCDRQFVVGQEYPLIPEENRSIESHSHYFACVNEAWKNLAEEFSSAFPSPSHLRAWALVECGFATETKYVLDTPHDAQQFAIMVRKMSPFAIIRVRGNIVQVFEAESQSRANMKAKRFQESKDAVLNLVATMSRTTTVQLRRETMKQIPHANREKSGQ